MVTRHGRVFEKLNHALLSRLRSSISKDSVSISKLISSITIWWQLKRPRDSAGSDVIWSCFEWRKFVVFPFVRKKNVVNGSRKITLWCWVNIERKTNLRRWVIWSGWWNFFLLRRLFTPTRLSTTAFRRPVWVLIRTIRVFSRWSAARWLIDLVWRLVKLVTWCNDVFRIVCGRRKNLLSVATFLVNWIIASVANLNPTRTVTPLSPLFSY